MTRWPSSLAPRWWAALGYTGASGVVLLGALGGANHGAVRVGLFLAAAALAAVQVAAQHRRERAAKTIAEETRTVTNNAMSNAFAPLLGWVAELEATTDDADRERLRTQIRASVAFAASLAIGPDQGVRACIFDVDRPQAPRTLTWSRVHAGRADEPHSTFQRGTVRGDLALAMVEQDTFAFCRDTESDPPPGWEEHPHDYRTFLAVPVRAGGRPVGMLTVDSLTAGDLEPDRDKPILTVLAQILAVCRARDGTWSPAYSGDQRAGEA